MDHLEYKYIKDRTWSRFYQTYGLSRLMLSLFKTAMWAKTKPLPITVLVALVFIPVNILYNYTVMAYVMGEFHTRIPEPYNSWLVRGEHLLTSTRWNVISKDPTDPRFPVVESIANQVNSIEPRHILFKGE